MAACKAAVFFDVELSFFFFFRREDLSHVNEFVPQGKDPGGTKKCPAWEKNGYFFFIKSTPNSKMLDLIIFILYIYIYFFFLKEFFNIYI